MRINDVISHFGVSQGSIVGTILFCCFFNDFLYFTEKTGVHNFADGNTLNMMEETIQNLIALLETESNTAMEWFQNNKIMVNPGKFQAIIIDKKKKCHTNDTLKIGDKIIKASSSINLLGVHTGGQLNFNLHISNICRSAANQLNALIRLKRFLAFEEKKTLTNSYSYESILKLAGKSTMNTRLRSLCIEVFTTLNNINPAFINEIFELRKTKSISNLI